MIYQIQTNTWLGSLSKEGVKGYSDKRERAIVRERRLQWGKLCMKLSFNCFRAAAADNSSGTNSTVGGANVILTAGSGSESATNFQR